MCFVCLAIAVFVVVDVVICIDLHSTIPVMCVLKINESTNRMNFLVAVKMFCVH